MKLPRIDDFDPNSKKEPTLKSSLENMPVIEKPKPAAPSAEMIPVRPVRLVPPVRVVPPVPPAPSQKRYMKQRHPFDIYHDQYDALKELALEDRKQGGVGSMSAMVREAIDKYIAEKRGKR